MKKVIPFILGAICLCLSSCLESYSNYTPQIAVSYPITMQGDTLKYRYDANTEQYNLDSLLVGDTVLIGVGYATLGNNLISTHVSWDTTALHIWSNFSDEYRQILLEKSDTISLNLYFPTGYNYAGIPLYVSPKRACSSSVRFTVNSDSEYSTAECSLVINAIQ